MLPSATRAVLAGLPRSICRPLVLRPAPLAQRGLVVSAWNLKQSTDSTEKPKAKKSAAAKDPKAKKSAKSSAASKKAKKPAEKQKTGPKPVSEEQKQKLYIKQLKEWALLDEPNYLPYQPWIVYVSQNFPKSTSSEKVNVVEAIKSLGPGYKELSESAMEELRATAAGNAKANAKARKEWIESHPPELIYVAQAARKRLAKEAKVGARRYPAIHDARTPKRTPSAYALYVQSRFDKTDGKATTETMAELAQSWNSLSESEKKPFVDLAASELERSSKLRAELKEKAFEYWTQHSTITPSRAKTDLLNIL